MTSSTCLPNIGLYPSEIPGLSNYILWYEGKGKWAGLVCGNVIVVSGQIICNFPFVVGLAYYVKDIAFRFIIEYSSIGDFGP
jgi:hypothetical protein